MLKGAKQNKRNLPDYDQKDIREIVEYLYSLGKELKQQSDTICVFYAEAGNLMLRDLYDKYN